MEEEELIDCYHGLILGALKKCHVYYTNPNFEDYVQIARITLIQCHREEIKKDPTLPHFNSFAYQRIYWKIMDTLREEQRLTLREVQVEPLTLAESMNQTSIDESLLSAEEQIEKLMPYLTKQEINYLIDSLVHQLTVSEISLKYHVSRRAVYNWRNHTSLKFLKYFNEKGSQNEEQFR
ncbi:sigma-70 family RNA polymerase sigma factor [Vagococcus silagei]|uniref:Sigma-70 family RNA polymerase sigma factor n=1 Tax=Vagococcus silagei TaxID=2508885 RepID=A0A4S3BA50_9ENTE|nr:sigma-70 family RNA polymerase sigma factor [Vagococcus silagei]THB62135.1 sigma-70 family RNA polymerase sigma factor [Vagococcus silagei]